MSVARPTAAEAAEPFGEATPEGGRRRTLVWQDPMPAAAAGATMTGLEAKYVRPITRDTGRVICEAEVLYRGRRQATSESSLTAADSGKLLAHGTATCMILAA
jgi:acyl-coenzyme A thioesterase PaaI-like protein